MDIKRILDNDVITLISKSDEGKSMLICSLIEEYKKKFSGDISAFGLRGEVIRKLDINSFNSLLELEKIKNEIVFIDEVGALFDLQNRKYRKQINQTLRLVNHNGNKIFMSGVCSDFKKFLCAKARCFLFKSLNISDLINGSLAKEILLQYKGDGVGFYSFDIDKSEVLCYDGKYFIEKFKYNKEYDFKRENKDLFQKGAKKGS